MFRSIAIETEQPPSGLVRSQSRLTHDTTLPLDRQTAYETMDRAYTIALALSAAAFAVAQEVSMHPDMPDQTLCWHRVSID